jgi:hypothetical protein
MRDHEVSHATERAERLVTEGAAVTAIFPDGLTLGPHPIDWLKVTDHSYEYLWIGEDEWVHLGDVASAELGEDGELTLRRHDGLTVVMEPVWDGRHQRMLDRWSAAQRDGEVPATNYPAGGWRYEPRVFTTRSISRTADNGTGSPSIEAVPQCGGRYQ